MKREEFIKLGLMGGFLGGIGLSLVGLKDLVIDPASPKGTLSFRIEKMTTNFHVRHGLYVVPPADVVYSTSVSEVRKDVFVRGGVTANGTLDMFNYSFNLKGERYSLHLLEGRILFSGGGISTIQKLDANLRENIGLLINGNIECRLYSNTSEVQIQESGEYLLIPISNEMVVNDVSIEQDAFMRASAVSGGSLRLTGRNASLLLVKTS